MDRFIDADGVTEYYLASYLKSNMDRFIAYSKLLIFEFNSI